MKIFRISPSFRFILLAILLPFLPGSVPVLKAQEMPPVQEVEIPTPAYQRYLDVVAETTRLREAQDTAGLEALAGQLRQSKEALDGGTWLLSHFYANAVFVSRTNGEEAEKAMDFYREWARKSPDSITAQVCLAEALTSYAWNARGSGYSSTVTDEGWRLFKERLKESWEVLSRAKDLQEKCPEWYSAAQTVGLGQGWEPDRYMKMVDEALEKEPTYGKYYAKTCYYLFPRWHGETGDFEKWIQERADAYPPEERDIQYARFVWMVDTLGFREEIVFGKGRLDWERARSGFEAWLKKTPNNLMVQLQYLNLALMADDRATARRIFDDTQGKYWPPMWGENQSKFEMAREYAYGTGTNPLKNPVRPTAKNSPKIPPEILVYVPIFFRVFAGFFGGLIAGSLALVIALRCNQSLAGVSAFILAVVFGTVLGTMAAAFPVFVLLLYILRKPTEGSPEEAMAFTPGKAFLGLILVIGANLLLQICASGWASISYVMLDPKLASNTHQLSERIYHSGDVFYILVNAGWISFLVLMLFCGNRTLEGYRKTLSVFACSWKQALVYLIAAFLFLFAVSWVLDIWTDAKTHQAMEDMASGVKFPVIFLLSVVVVAPMGEELLFRGFLFQALYPRLGFWVTSLAGSVIFSLNHFQYGWTGLLYILILSLSLYALRWKTGSVLPPLALHMLNNAISALAAFS